MEIKNIKGDVIRTINDDDLKFGVLNLRGADLRDADLRGANLRGANLYGAYLRGAYLRDADLRDADLYGADLRGADLRGAYLRGANLRGADLRDGDLYGADLYCADLRGADLGGTNLYDSNLCCANLRGANLRGANLCGANLRGADLSGADLIDIKYNTNTSFYAPVPPEKGSFIAYKKIKQHIIELEIPADAERSSATTRKCRCSKAKVLGVYNFDGTPADIDTIVNNYYAKTTYKVGEMVYPDSWDEDRWNECSHGIHFFMTFDEAKTY